MLKGIDESSWQRNNYEALTNNYAKDFVIVRAAFSKTVDPYCDKMYQYAKGLGKKLGFYFFPLTSDGTPEDCAEWAYNQVLGYIGEAIPCLDWEAHQNTATHDYKDVDWALRWLEKFEELSGVKPMIYMNSSLERSLNWTPVVQNDNGLWIANYGNNDGTDHGRPATTHWKSAAMHQYTSLGDNGRGLDCDTFYGDAAAWDAYCKSEKSAGATMAQPMVTPKTDADIERAARDVIAGKYGNGDARFKKLSDEGFDAMQVQDRVNQLLRGQKPYTEYVVKAGDTLSAIAKQFGTTYTKIAQDNNIANVSLIYPGMKLKIYK